MQLRFGDVGERTHVLRGGRREVVNQGVRVFEDVVNQDGVFTDSVVDFCGQHTVVASGAGMDVFPLFQHLSRLGGRSEQPTLFRGNPFAGDTDLLTDLGRFGEKGRQGLAGLCHRFSPPVTANC